MRFLQTRHRVDVDLLRLFRVRLHEFLQDFSRFLVADLADGGERLAGLRLRNRVLQLHADLGPGVEGEAEVALVVGFLLRHLGNAAVLLDQVVQGQLLPERADAVLRRAEPSDVLHDLVAVEEVLVEQRRVVLVVRNRIRDVRPVVGENRGFSAHLGRGLRPVFLTRVVLLLLLFCDSQRVAKQPAVLLRFEVRFHVAAGHHAGRAQDGTHHRPHVRCRVVILNFVSPPRAGFRLLRCCPRTHATPDCTSHHRSRLFPDLVPRPERSLEARIVPVVSLR
mmetsp:Transcript_28606/g.72491  ORF Transcript_28606/g.72491 Transcript_28606/m.72491 type:complete len:279 (-) Transcript_28606:514-1350(-)